MVAKLSSDRIIRPAFLATSVPVPMAMPMSAALMAGASLTPSPVMATTSPFLRRVSTSSTLCSGATRPTTPMSSIRASRSASGQGREVGAQDRLAGDAELLGDGRTGDDVVAGDHAHPDVRGLRVGRPRPCDSSRGGSIMPTRLVSSQIADVAEQVAVGLERGRVEVAVGGGHHPQALALHPLDVGLGPSPSARRPAARPARRTVPWRARPITAGAAPLTKQRTTFLPELSVALLKVAISL